MNNVSIRKKEQRNFEVLAHIVRRHISSAMPVSSKVVAQGMGDRVSSATVRNIMGDLERRGFIEQPHTSAGRVPTDRGYRYYVDAARIRMQMEKRRAERLAREYARRIRSIEELLERTSSLISHELHNAGFVMWPSIEDLYLKRLELIRIRARTALAVLITTTNAVKKYIIRLEEDLRNPELESVANYINANYEDAVISRMADDLRHILRTQDEDGKDVIRIAGRALGIVDDILETDAENEIYLEGLEQFMEEPEFRNVGIARSMLKVFFDRKYLSRLMRGELPFRDIRIYIGRENPIDMLRDCSIITSGYGMHGRTIGRFGVIGPTRMDYDNAIRTVSMLSGIISAKLEELNR
jgi:heat-inducible transcriptional repressor